MLKFKGERLETENLWDWKINRSKTCYSRTSLQPSIGSRRPDLANVKKNRTAKSISSNEIHLSEPMYLICVSFDGVFMFIPPSCSICSLRYSSYVFICIYLIMVIHNTHIFPHSFLQLFRRKMFRACSRERKSCRVPFITDVINRLYWIRPLPAAFCHFSCATAHFPQHRISPTHP